MKYVYHFKRPSMVGNILYPLNELKHKHPETFDSHAKKYKGRELLMERRIPGLDCLWNDVIHLSPINPQIILDIWEECGLKVPDLEFPTYKIPIENLNSKKLIYFDPQVSQHGKLEVSEKQVRPFIIDEFEELKTVNQEQIDVWKNDRAEGRQMFWFSHTTHVLYKGSIDVSDVEVILCK